MAVLVTYTGAGRALSFGSKKGVISYSYNSLSSIYSISLDYGLITDSYELSEDYGSISNTISQSEDFGDVHQPTIPAFGTIKNIVSNTTIGFSLLSVGGIQFALQGGSYESFGSPFIGYGLTKQLGGVADSVSPTTYIGKGSLFGFSGAAERVSFSYNESSVALFASVENYGFISSPQEDSEDYGLIIDPIDALSSEEYGYVSFRENIPFGDLIFRGDASKTVIFELTAFVGGSLFAFTGSGESFIPTPINASGLFRISGAATESIVPSTEIGSGTLFNFVSKEERRTYSYNGSSVVLGESEDYGFIDSLPENSEDYGLVNDTSTITNSENYGLITLVGKKPFGSLSFVGDASKTVTFKLRYFGSGSLFAFTGSGESFIPGPVDASGLFKISGAATNIQNVSSEVGSGTLFNFITKEERRTYSYNGSASVGDILSIDFGSINESPYNYLPPQTIADYADELISTYADEIIYEFGEYPFNDDYGNISSSATSFEDYGSVPILKSNKPYGSFKFSGSSGQVASLGHVGSGSLFTFVGSTKSFIQNPPESTELFKISGAATNIQSVSSEVGSGTLFNFITKEERRTYSYNGSSIILVEAEDYRFINSVFDESEDFGLIEDSEIVSLREDYGSIRIKDVRPYGSLRFSGSVGQVLSLGHIGSGSLFAFTGSAESFIPATIDASGLFRISGTAEPTHISLSYVGSGTLFNFITKEERRTYSYNSSAVIGEVTSIDYGFISAISEESEDYGYLTFEPGIVEDYNLISQKKQAPYGFLRFTGSVGQVLSLGHIGSGSLFTFVGSGESTTAKPESKVLFRLSGSATESTSTGEYFGSGTLFNFITKEERRTYSYNSSSIFGELEINDYGFISAVPEESEDYGYLEYTTISSYDFGLISQKRKAPYGFLRFSSSSVQAASLGNIGSGSLFAFTGSAESFIPATIDALGLFRISGSADESITPSTEIGSGTLFSFVSATETSGVSEQKQGTFRISGKAEPIYITFAYFGSGGLFALRGSAESASFAPKAKGILNFVSTTKESFGFGLYSASGSLFTFVKKEERRVFSYVGSTESRITGTLIERNTEGYFGSGRLFAYTGSADVVGYKPPANVLFKFLKTSGTVRFNGAYTSSGTINFKPGSTIVDPNDKILISSAKESATISALIPPSGFRVQGELGRIFFQYREIGKGRFTVTGEAVIKTNPIHFGSGFVRPAGTSPEAFVPAPHIGTGSLFGFVGGAESTTPAPKIGSGLFKFLGNATDIKETNSEVGSGILSRINVESNIIVRFRYPVTGNADINGAARQRKLNHYTSTSGSFIISGTAGQFFSNKFFSNGDPIRIRSTDTPNSITKTIIGSGALFGFVSSTESVGANPPIKTTAFKVSGSAVVKNTESFNGTGTIRERQASSTGGLILDLEPATISEFADEIISDYALIPIVAIRTILPDFEPKTRLIAAFESYSPAPPSKDKPLKVTGTLEDQSVSRIHIGSGKLFAFDSLEESATFVPAETGALFEFNGNSVERSTNSIFGEGSLFGFGNGAESILIDYDSSSPIGLQNTILRINGSGSESFVPATHIGSGILSAFTGSSESKTIGPVDTKVLFEITGSSTSEFGSSYVGSGKISTFLGSSRTASYSYTISQKAFAIFGATLESFGKANYTGQCEAQFVGRSVDIKIDFEEPKPPIMYIM